MEEDFARPDESTRLVDCANEFRIHIQSFLARTTDIETREVLSGRSTWEDIQREASEALVKYQNDGKTWRHPFQTAGRAFSSVSSRLEFLLELLPNGDYGSLLFAGLRLVFNAAKRMQAIRESVMKSFSSLSETIDSTYHYIRVYSGDYILRQRSEDLYIAILEAVRGVTIWLTANPLAQSFKAFFQQNDYGKKLEAKMTTSIQDKASKFEERVQVLLHIKVQNIDQNVISVKHDITEVISDLREKGTTMASLEEMLRGLKLDLDCSLPQLCIHFLCLFC
ncbi:hypothetical protein N7456_011965 [Penicillium angulare]|uniref:DUF7708 domain-containing protein n=1 Tax=Penicillium angulare TaxID=116970 RepID=A0A9W9K078_9EURO|nr:hypothetical protein N7456_011965 [Penicillium angulare]